MTGPNPNLGPNTNPHPIPNPNVVVDLRNKETLNSFSYVHAVRPFTVWTSELFPSSWALSCTLKPRVLSSLSSATVVQLLVLLLHVVYCLFTCVGAGRKCYRCSKASSPSFITLHRLLLLLCEYLKFRIELNSYYSIWSKNQSNYSKFLNSYLNVICTRKVLCVSVKMWLSAVLLLTMVLILDSSWSLYIGPLWPTKYWKNTTACLQHKPLTGWHKTVETTQQVLTNSDFENCKNCSVPFEILNDDPIFDSIRNERNTIRTALLLLLNYLSISHDSVKLEVKLCFIAGYQVCVIAFVGKKCKLIHCVFSMGSRVPSLVLPGTYLSTLSVFQHFLVK